MLESKFKDREFLSRYHLDVKLLNNYNFTVNDVIPVRKIYILVTNKGNKILKKLDYAIERLEFINTAMKYMKDNGFNQGINFEKNKNGDIYTQWRDSTYVVMDLINGRECEYNNPLEVAIAVKTLAKMHLSSKGFKGDNWSKYSNLEKAIEEYEKNLGELNYFKKLVSSYENKSEFDELFLNSLDKFISHMARGVSILKKSEYDSLCREEDNIAICHQDLAYHNILIDNEEAYFIDFDYAVIDLRVNDLCNIINKVTKGFAYDLEKVIEIIENYKGTSPIDSRELKVLYGMLWIPEGFCNLIKDYYLKRKLWGEDSFSYKLRNKVENLKEKEDMLESFKDHYNL
ncbi:CotS family spore coat protein [Clostridium tunisiense]|uniref:CotS family spore coat protein n=1 Tax=Clostridium tunisiense TaxID=219748 RepID=UPI0002D90F20|nr:CotS family spore coat protein [Clostridium tunisiense]